MNLFKKILPFVILIFTFSYCSNNNDIDEEVQEAQEEIVYSIVAPFYPIDFEAEGNGGEWSWTILKMNLIPR